jgi:hypothetical protein
MAKKLTVIVGCDCDPDRPRYGGPRYDDRRSPLKWRGVNEGISLLHKCLQRIESVSGVKVKVTFFLRSDTQMAEIHGAAAWPALEYAGMWRELEEQGHELAWHPHLWRWSSQWECWFQETQDSEWIDECLNGGHTAISDALGRNPASCHMGWTFQNNITMNALSRLGVGIDFSACPGVYSEGGPGNSGTRYDNMIDWIGTPRKWYRPSAVDYRRPARAGEDELGIIELPKFTSESGMLKKAKSLATRTGGATASAQASAVFVQITASPIIYSRIIKERLKTEEAEPFFATYFHPDELLTDRPRSARGFLYSLANMERNLLTIIEAAKKNNREVEFATGAEALQHIFGVREGGRD